MDKPRHRPGGSDSEPTPLPSDGAVSADDSSPDPIEDLLARASVLPPEQRRRFLDALPPEHAHMREELESLLSYADDDPEFMEAPAYEEFQDLLPPPYEPESSDPSRRKGDPEAYPGARIGPYRLQKLIGHGGMGVVYRAEQEEPVYRVVAIKLLKLGMDSRQVVARFEQERQALAMMEHPNIASVYEAGTTASGRLYFAMEYVSGVPITEYCRLHDLELRKRLRLFNGVCHAVQHAHQKGIVHRDLKPTNILITDSTDPSPKIIDFGVAKALHRPLTDKTLFTEHGIRIGTPAYMSPEQADLTRDIDTRTDIYSLGVVLYELITGQLPFDRETRRVSLVDLYRSASDELPPAPSRRLPPDASTSMRRQVDGDLDAIILKTLERDRDRRYASASELAADIERFLSGEPVLARTPSAAYRLKKLVSKNRVVASSLAFAFLTVCVGFLVSTQLWLQNKEARELVTKQRDEILTYSDSFLLEQTLTEMNELWPAVPATVAAMQSWLGGTAHELADRLSLHRTTLGELDQQLARLGPSDPGRAALESRRSALAVLVERLTGFVDPDPAIGAIAQMRSRLEFARTVHAKTVEEPRELWDTAIASIRNPAECPQYGGLEIPPQLGLIPLGRDPDSGLWEFAHLQSGTPPERGNDGRLILEEDSAIVLVLLPGGTFLMGNQRDAPPPEGTGGVTNYDPFCRSNELPVHEVTLDPFFFSKYEVSQAQWLRLTGHNPSRQPPGSIWGDKVHTLLHPVEQVNWQEASAWTQRAHLDLATEAQWEYAARAGTHTAWWAGPRESDLAGTCNVQDSFASRYGRYPERIHGTWNDGYADTAPIGTYRGNPFGIHDTVGNVWEWCKDLYGAYTLPVRAGDGFRLGTTVPERSIRSGAYDRAPEDARTGRREHLHEGKEVDVGVRPIRPVIYDSPTD